jgi:hypothetical protein
MLVLVRKTRKGEGTVGGVHGKAETFEYSSGIRSILAAL